MNLPIHVLALTVYQYVASVLLGVVRDLLAFRFWTIEHEMAPLLSDWSSFYERRMYSRIRDCFNRIVSSSPASWISLSNQGQQTWALNLASYNYLGFGGHDNVCTPSVLASLHSQGASLCSHRSTAGTSPQLLELERAVAAFVGQPAALVCGMGFATNANIIPLLVGRGALIVSDELNHTSIAVGARLSGAKIVTFRHNDLADLERVLVQSIIAGQCNKTASQSASRCSSLPWTKILIIVEGIYSMEGDTPDLPAIVALKKKYGAYLWVDEAHSIGALGATGRGLCEHQRVNVLDIDVSMGTFTKAFGAVGGYIAATADMIAALRARSSAHVLSGSLAPPACAQALAAIRELQSPAGLDRVRRLQENSRMFRRRLIEAGLAVLGNEASSPVCPILLGIPAKMAAFSRECLARNVAVVVVGYPATPLLLPRARICISAAHTRDDLEYALEVILQVADLCRMRYRHRICG